jgi:protein involved in polysaccharide export with SLBB domain
MKKIFFVIVLFLALYNSQSLYAQDLLKISDLSTIKVDYLTDDDIAKIKTQLKSNTTTIEQVESLLIGKGMPTSEYAKLKTRLGLPSIKILTDTTSRVEINEDDVKDKQIRKQEKIENKKVKDTLNALIFGSELFDKPDLNFEPNLNLATPVNYILGPRDELQISVYGVQEFNARTPVTSEGTINIQYIGEISVAGMTIEAATIKIKSAIAKVYTTVYSGQSRVGISLTRIRTIKVTIIGSKQPGNYSVSSLSTVYNALFISGGPTANGSYRNIELLRDNKIVKKVDIYNFLVNGNQSDNVGLKDNDVIRIPAYAHRVTIEGQVKRPGIFELKPNETFTDLLVFASGFNELAYTASVNILQKTNKELRVKDIKQAEFSTYKPSSGDLFKVSKILARFENRITISGSVFRPETYSFFPGMRISDLVKQAEGLKDDAYKQRATIIRKRDDLTTELVTVNLGKAVSGDLEANTILRKEDLVQVYSVLDFKEEYKLTIDGEVKKPGVYDFYDNISLNDLLVQAGGLTGAASKRVEIARMIKSDEIISNNLSRVQLFNLEINAGNNEQIKNFNLAPFDIVNIRKMALYEKPELVTVTGAINYTGKYVLTNKKEKIYDVIQRAGGLSEVADLDGVKIKRLIKAKQIEDLENVNLNLGKKDSIQNKLTKKLKQDLKYATIPVEWREILKNPNDKTNVTLFPDDEIVVSVFNENVKVTGSVLLTSEIPYNKGRGFDYYLEFVGGTDSKGWKRKAYIIYPNGKAAVSTNFLFIRSYPRVLPGSQIVIPEKPETKKMSTSEWVSIGSIITSLALLAITAFK